MESICRLLIVDDDPSILGLLEVFLTNNHYDVVCVTNSLDGLKQIESSKKSFDLIITDLVMPDISGVGLISILKKEHPEIPIIAITGKGAEPEKLSLEASVDAILQKPFGLDTLQRMITSLVSK
jgi:DNA-binding response OmpR family regulator